jgi:hypothetical protein
MLHKVFEAETGNYLGDVVSPYELHLGDGIADHDGRVFRVRSLKHTRAGASRLRRLEVVETVDTLGRSSAASCKLKPSRT